MPSIYEQIGGEPAMNAAVDIFYKKVIADPLLAPFFDGIDLDRQRKMQKAFLSQVLGGPQQYSGKAMRAAHKRQVEEGMGIEHFNHVATHLQNTLQELNVPGDLVSEIMTTAASTKDDVLGL